MPRILIVDDDDSMRGVLKDRLEDVYDIIDTGDPKEAIALALQHKPDAILLDLMMPQFSGFEICHSLSSLSFTQQIPILIVSGEPAMKYQGFCQNLGASGYFEKPVDFQQLKSRLTSLLQIKRPDRRTEARVRLNVILKLKGTDETGTPFELLTTTENVSANGFLCGCTAAISKDATVEVYLCGEDEHYAGSARVVRTESHASGCSRYGFGFVEKPTKWILQ